ncbi:ribosome maturation factor RimP [Arcanobacterium hippocoleae]|uniref:Ribosome maturation factor RimP n=1 Tax=Arcanobacterium hippocoleae TaxID=149017 RepID=A0ABU1T161_9ACTO|nr:ribosome maturation factor RimP [Arcanobacterium hippocoleae]MDR6939073.1 ribosome maturation factor RimP [Arcanobacterium hippocoleae]
MVQNIALEDKIREIVAAEIAIRELYLEEVRIVRAGKFTTVRITVDLPAGQGGVSAAQLDEITRVISDLLDISDPIAGEYNLEISTPGTDRKLSTPRHYSRAIGRLAEFKLIDGTKFQARISATTSHSATVIPEKKVPKSDKVIYEPARELEFEQVKTARVMVELKKSANDSDEGE